MLAPRGPGGVSSPHALLGRAQDSVRLWRPVSAAVPQNVRSRSFQRQGPANRDPGAKSSCILQIKFYLNAATPTRLRIVCG